MTATLDPAASLPVPPTLVRPKSPRVVGYDLARAWAIFGMVAVHAALVLSRAGETDRPGPAAILRRLDGRPAALFVLLAGIGISLRVGGVRAAGGAGAAREAVDHRRRAARTLVRRGLFLLVVGFLNLVVWEGDILRVYGVSLIVAAGLLGVRGRTLWLVAAGFVAGFVSLLATVDYGANWDWRSMAYHRLWTPAGVVRNLFYDGFRSVFPWTGLLVVGMWLGRLDVRRPQVRRRMLLWGGGLAVATELASWLVLRWWLTSPGGTEPEDIVAVAGTVSMPPLPAFLLAAGGTAVAAVGAALMLADRFAGSPLVRAMVAAGQMAFTWYLAHIALIAIAFVAGATESMSFAGAIGVAAAFFAATLVASAAWKRRFRHGPLEWVMRATTGG